MAAIKKGVSLSLVFECVIYTTGCFHLIHSGLALDRYVMRRLLRSRRVLIRFLETDWPTSRFPLRVSLTGPLDVVLCIDFLFFRF